MTLGARIDLGLGDRNVQRRVEVFPDSGEALCRDRFDHRGRHHLATGGDRLGVGDHVGERRFEFSAPAGKVKLVAAHQHRCVEYALDDVEVTIVDTAHRLEQRAVVQDQRRVIGQSSSLLRTTSIVIDRGKRQSHRGH